MTGTVNQVFQDGGPAVTAAGLNAFAQVCETVAVARAFVGITGMSIIVQGAAAPGDGGGGSFYWNAGGTAPDDNGETTIQPPDSGMGQWTRDDLELDNVVTLNGVQTLTNKTLTAPIINNPTVTGGSFTGITINGVNFLTNTPNDITTTYTVQASDGGKTIYAGGNAYYTITVSAPSAYISAFQCVIKNTDSGRGKLISISGITPFILWPLQSFIMQSNNGASWTLIGAPARWIVTAGINFYVDAALGNDANDGLNPGTGNAFQTIAQAYSIIKTQLDCAGFTQQINLADGTYNVGAGVNILYPLVGSAQFSIAGDAASPHNVIISCSPGGNCLFVREAGAVVTIWGCYFQTSGNGSTAIGVSQGAVCDIGNPGNGTQGNVFGNFPTGIHISVTNTASGNILANYEVDSNCAVHVSATFAAYMNYGSFTVNIPNPLTFTDWISAGDLGMVNAGGVPMTFTGAGAGAASTGKRYSSTNNADINSSSTTYPGATAGTTANGGLYS